MSERARSPLDLLLLFVVGLALAVALVIAAASAPVAKTDPIPRDAHLPTPGSGSR